MGAPTTTEVASLFGALSPAFPGWQNPSPNAYTYTLPQQGWWQTLFGGGAIKDAVNWLADLALQLVAWGLHIGILVASRFSDPGWLLDPVAKRLGQVFRAGYGGVFLRILPFLLLATALYVVWQYIRARHEKILTAVVSTALTGALIFAFFFNFGWLFKTVNGLAQSLTDTLGDAVVSTVQTRPGSMYDALWDVYVLNTWEAGQFGHASSNIQDFDVSQEVLAKGETYTNDAGQTVALQPGDNWVKLLLQNRTDAARQSLLQDLTSVDHPFAQTSWTTADVEGASPYSNFVFDILTFLMMIPTLIFLGFMAFLLFSQSLMFLFLALLGIVTVPVAFIPEVGWMVTLRWMREAVGYLLLKMFNVVYMAVAFGLAELVTQSLAVSGGEDQLVLAMMADALIFLAALLFHAKVLHALRPYVEAVQGLGRRAEEAGEENHRVSDAATDARRDAVREASLSGRFRVSSQNARSAANDAVRAGASEPQRGVVGRLASAFSREAVVGAVKAKVADAMDSLRNPQRTTWQERAQRRADRVVALERRAHGAGIAAHAAAGRLAVKGGRAALRWAFETRTGSPASVDEAQETGQAAVPETGGPVQNDVESGGVERRADIPSPARQAAPDHPSDAEAGRARRRMEAPDGEGSARATRGTTQRA
ncbi:MAG: type IV secretion system protein, partial [Alicyclobacillaceae bacterium]|nr:type IV secretion system protein [Alicyclobacillaceae bacterium]